MIWAWGRVVPSAVATTSASMPSSHNTPPPASRPRGRRAARRGVSPRRWRSVARPSRSGARYRVVADDGQVRGPVREWSGEVDVRLGRAAPSACAYRPEGLGARASGPAVVRRPVSGRRHVRTTPDVEVHRTRLSAGDQHTLLSHIPAATASRIPPTTDAVGCRLGRRSQGGGMEAMGDIDDALERADREDFTRAAGQRADVAHQLPDGQAGDGQGGGRRARCQPEVGGALPHRGTQGPAQGDHRPDRRCRAGALAEGSRHPHRDHGRDPRTVRAHRTHRHHRRRPDAPALRPPRLRATPLRPPAAGRRRCGTAGDRRPRTPRTCSRTAASVPTGSESNSPTSTASTCRSRQSRPTGALGVTGWAACPGCPAVFWRWVRQGVGRWGAFAAVVSVR